MPEPTVPESTVPEPTAIVLTGANGWFGRAYLATLLGEATPLALHLLVHDDRDAAELDEFVRAHAATASQPGVTIVAGDVADAQTATRLMRGVEPGAHVVHAAGVIHPRRVEQFTRVNLDGTVHLLGAARTAGVARFVYVSSNSPLGTNADPSDVFRGDEPFHPYLGYGESKMRAELAVADAVRNGLDAVIVRPPWFYGEHQPPRQTTFFRMIRTGRFPVIGAGDQRRSMVYVGNLVDGVRAAQGAGRAGRAWWIADARPYEVREIVATVGRALEAEGLTVKPNTARLPTIVARVAERADRAIQRLGRYQQQLHVLGEMGHTIACDISTARAELGYEPRVELYEGMRRSIRWCLDQGLEL